MRITLVFWRLIAFIIILLCLLVLIPSTQMSAHLRIRGGISEHRRYMLSSIRDFNRRMSLKRRFHFVEKEDCQ